MADPVTPPERWLPVPGYEGLYEASDLGRVQSVERWIIRSDGLVSHWHGRVLRQHTGPGTHGYPMVGLSREGRKKNRLVHQLVLEAFTGPCPAGQEARHGPAGKTDASLANLCWGTRKENFADRARDGQDNPGERNGQAKLTWEAVEDIRRRVASGEFQSDLAARYGVCKQTVCLLVHGKTWRVS